MQTTLLGLAIALILALVAALVGPHFVDWSQFRPRFEAEATRALGTQVRVGGAIDARLLPSPSLRLNDVAIGGANDLGRVRADRLNVEFSLGDLMRGEWRATELSVGGLSMDLGLDARGKLDWPVVWGKLNLGALSIDRLNVTGRIALHDAASRTNLELSDIAFSGDVRAQTSSVRGDGNVTIDGTRYPFRLSTSALPDGSGNRVRVGMDALERGASGDIEGVLAFEGESPRFDGALTLARPPRQEQGAPPPWKVTAKLKADPAAARLEQIEASYGPDDQAVRLTGRADLRFGASPLFRAELSSRALDADRLLGGDGTATPLGWFAALRRGLAELQAPPLPAEVEIAFDTVTLGGRPLQGFSALLKSDARVWTAERLDMRLPGQTRLSLVGARQINPVAGGFASGFTIETAEPDVLAAWLQRDGDLPLRAQKPLRARGRIEIAPDRVVIDDLNTGVDGSTITGRLVYTGAMDAGRTPTSLDLALKADQLDLDATAALVRGVAGASPRWPDEAQVSLDIARATLAGQQVRPVVVRLAYDPDHIALDQLQAGGADGASVSGSGSLDRKAGKGDLRLDGAAGSLAALASAIAPFAPQIASRLDALPAAEGPARLKLALALESINAADRATARGTLDLQAPQLQGTAKLRLPLAAAALQGLEIERIARGDVEAEAKFSAPKGEALLVLLGLSKTVAAGEGPLSFDGTAKGPANGSLRVAAALKGNTLDAQVQGSAEPFAAERRAALTLNVRNADLAPLLAFSANAPANVALTSRVAMRGDRLSFSDLDGRIGGSRIRGKLDVTLDETPAIEGDVGMDALDIPVLAGIFAGGAEDARPLDASLIARWRGQVAFQALRATLPGGSEMRMFGGVIKGDGTSLALERAKGNLGDGELTADLEARPAPSGVMLNGHLNLANVDGAALRYRALAAPAGRITMQATLASQGRSSAALAGALSGSGQVAITNVKIGGLGVGAFTAALAASDAGKVADDVALKAVVEPALAAGSFAAASAQIPFNLRDGRIRIGPATLDGEGTRLLMSGGFDVAADQIDARVSLVPTAIGTDASRPELSIFLMGTPDAPQRMLDVSSLSSWLALRAIDRETRRLDAIARGEASAPVTPSPSLAPSANPSGGVVPGAPQIMVPAPESDPRRAAPPKAAPQPRPQAANPPAAPGPAPPASSVPPPARVAPLPPPIDVRPVPGSQPSPPRARVPLDISPR